MTEVNQDAAPNEAVAPMRVDPQSLVAHVFNVMQANGYSLDEAKSVVGGIVGEFLINVSNVPGMDINLPSSDGNVAIVGIRAELFQRVPRGVPQAQEAVAPAPATAPATAAPEAE